MICVLKAFFLHCRTSYAQHWQDVLNIYAASGPFDRWLLVRCQPPSTLPLIWTRECRQIKKKTKSVWSFTKIWFIFSRFCESKSTQPVHNGFKKPTKTTKNASKASPDPHCSAASRNRRHVGSWHPARGHIIRGLRRFSIWRHCQQTEIDQKSQLCCSLCVWKLLATFLGRKWVSNKVGNLSHFGYFACTLKVQESKSSERRAFRKEWRNNYFLY